MEKQEKIQNRQRRRYVTISLSIIGVVVLFGIVWFGVNGPGGDTVEVDVQDTASSLKQKDQQQQQHGGVRGIERPHDSSRNAAAAAVEAVPGDHDDEAGNAVANIMAKEMIEETEEELEKQYMKLDGDVRKRKREVDILQTDPKGIELTTKLQDVTRKLIKKRYGTYTTNTKNPYRIKLDLEFKSSIPDYKENGSSGTILIELAPIDLIPYSVYNYLEIARLSKGGAFHRRAGHVLQAMVKKSPVRALAFQEYSEKFPHKKGTVGYCGRPSGPGWYVSIQNNVRNHGPGSQQKANPYEADAAIGTVIEGFNDVVLKRITKMPFDGFTSDANLMVHITKMTIMVPDDHNPGQFKNWIPKS